MNRIDIGIKGACLRAAEEGDGRTVEGIAVPFGQVIDTWGGKETFDPDCAFDGLDAAKLCYEHGETIGRITDAHAEADGLHITARISDTGTGRDALTLLTDGVIDSMSVGFVPIESTEDEEGVTHRRHVRLLETSLVSWPAYEAARITGHRSAGNADDKTTEKEAEKEYRMTDELTAIIESIQTEQRDMKASLARLAAPDDPAPAGARYRTAGDYLKALANGDDEAAALMKASRDLIATGDTAKTATWIADDLRLIEQRRKVAGILTHDTLPATGMSMEYVVVDQDTTAVAQQADEGDPLAFGKVTFATRTADIRTYGGYTTLSRQVIDRSTVPVLNTALAALRNAYAKVTETTIRTFLYALIAAQRDAATDANKIDAPAALTAMTIDQWAGLIMDAAELADDRNVSLTRLGVSKDVMAALVALKDTGSRFFDLSGDGSDTLGDFDLTGIAGRFLRVPVQMLPGAPAGTAAFIDPESVTVWESGGPTQLTDGDATKLTDNYSVYGYMAVAATRPLGLIPVKFKAAA